MLASRQVTDEQKHIRELMALGFSRRCAEERHKECWGLASRDGGKTVCDCECYCHLPFEDDPMTDDELNDWGLEFLNQIDRDLSQPGKGDDKIAWESGEHNDAMRIVRDNYPTLTEEQLDWIYEFISQL